MTTACLGKSLPKHELMQNLLNGVVKKPIKNHKSTQTEYLYPELLDKPITKNCLSGRNQFSKLGIRANGNQNQNNECEQLINSIREKIALARGENEFCSCSDNWSDNSLSEIDVTFPKETRNAAALSLFHQKNPKFTQKSKVYSTLPHTKAWPGSAASVIPPKENKSTTFSNPASIKMLSKLSKNKLNRDCFFSSI